MQVVSIRQFVHYAMWWNLCFSFFCWSYWCMYFFYHCRCYDVGVPLNIVYRSYCCICLFLSFCHKCYWCLDIFDQFLLGRTDVYFGSFCERFYWFIVFCVSLIIQSQYSLDVLFCATPSWATHSCWLGCWQYVNRRVSATQMMVWRPSSSLLRETWDR